MAMSWYVLIAIFAFGMSTQLTPVGVSLFFAVRGIAAKLNTVRDLTEIKSVEKEDRMISEGTEDGI